MSTETALKAALDKIGFPDTRMARQLDQALHQLGYAIVPMKVAAKAEITIHSARERHELETEVGCRVTLEACTLGAMKLFPAELARDAEFVNEALPGILSREIGHYVANHVQMLLRRDRPPRLPVYHDGAFVGTIPNLPSQTSTSPLYDWREGDFVLVEVEGQAAFRASPMLSIGDIQCVKGFETTRSDLPAPATGDFLRAMSREKPK